MLKIYDQEHRQLRMLTGYTDLKIESVLDNADKTLSFTVRNPDEIELKNEYYVRTREDEFVIKKISHKSWSGMSVTCLLNLEELQGQPFTSFVVVDKKIKDAAELALDGTGWSVGYCDVDKIRSAGMVECNALQVIENLCAAWMCEHSFDTLHKRVNFFNRIGTKKGAYFMDGLNLKQVKREIDSYDYYTIIIPCGKDGLTIESVNNGKNYLENYQYSNKKLAYIWKDESYTDPQAMKEDAEEKLNEMSKPAKTYACDVIDLASQRKDYGILSYGLGDEVKLINRETRTLEWQRIKKTTTYPNNPEKNTCELSNTVLTFTEMQEKLKKASEIINYVITTDGKIHVSDILNLEQGIAKTGVLQSFHKDLSKLQDDIKEMQGALGGIGNLHAEFAELGKANIPTGWVNNEMLENGVVTPDKIDIAKIIEAIFANVIEGAELTDAYLQNPRMSGAIIDADSLTVNGKDVVQIMESISGHIDNTTRIAELEKQVKNITSMLSDAMADDPAK